MTITASRIMLGILVVFSIMQLHSAERLADAPVTQTATQLLPSTPTQSRAQESTPAIALATDQCAKNHVYLTLEVPDWAIKAFSACLRARARIFPSSQE